MFMTDQPRVPDMIITAPHANARGLDPATATVEQCETAIEMLAEHATGFKARDLDNFSLKPKITFDPREEGAQGAWPVIVTFSEGKSFDVANGDSESSFETVRKNQFVGYILGLLAGHTGVTEDASSILREDEISFASVPALANAINTWGEQLSVGWPPKHSCTQYLRDIQHPPIFDRHSGERIERE